MHVFEREWRRLDERSRNLFGTYEWVACWTRHATPSWARTAALFQDGTLRAVAPLVATGARLARCVRVAGHDVADEAGFAADVEDRRHLPGLVRAALATCPTWDVFLGDHLPVDEHWSDSLGGTTLRREASPLLYLGGGTWEDYLADCSRSFRQGLRRRERALARSHAVRIRTAVDPERLPHDMATLFRLHEERFGPTPFSRRHRSFHIDFAAAAMERGWLRLRLLELEGRPVAAWYGFTFGGSAWFYQSGREAAAEPLGVGTVMTAHALRSAMEEGLDSYRFLRGDETYKRRWTRADRPVETLALPGSVRAAVSLSAARRLAAWPPARRVARRLVD